MIVLLGSKALAYYVKLDKVSIDIDILGDYDSVIPYIKSHGKPKSIYPTDGGKKVIAKFSDKIIEAEINWGHGSSKVLFDLVSNDFHTVRQGDLLIPSFNLLYTLKMSHRYLRNSPHFLKTMEHIHLMREKGARITPEYEEFLKLREEETYWYKHPKLNVGKKDFFKDDGIKYVYDHDSIHEAVKHLDKPAYTYYSTGEVMCSKTIWHNCSKKVKLCGVLEEAIVLALERSQIPFKDNNCPSARKSFEIALMKICTSITSGFFREWAYEHYYEVMDLYDDKYVEKFWNKVENGEVKYA